MWCDVSSFLLCVFDENQVPTPVNLNQGNVVYECCCCGKKRDVCAGFGQSKAKQSRGKEKGKELPLRPWSA